MDQIWKDMYAAAAAVRRERRISDYVSGRTVTLGEITPAWWIQ